MYLICLSWVLSPIVKQLSQKLINILLPAKSFPVIGFDKSRLGVCASIKIEREYYTKNIHVTTDPYRTLILPRHYTDYSKICSKLRINMTCLFILTSNFDQLLDLKNLSNHVSSIQITDVININNCDYEIISKDLYDKRFIYDSILNIGSIYTITYVKASESNFYRIIKSEMLL